MTAAYRLRANDRERLTMERDAKGGPVTVATAKHGPHGWEVRSLVGDLWPSAGKIAAKGTMTNLRVVPFKTMARSLLWQCADRDKIAQEMKDGPRTNPE